MLASLFFVLESFAQSYPTKPVRMVVPLAPGGSVDTLARVLAQKMSESMGQQVFVDNRGGASGNIGTELVVRAPADDLIHLNLATLKGGDPVRDRIGNTDLQGSTSGSTRNVSMFVSQ